MLSESVAQKPTIAVSWGTKTRQNSALVLNADGCLKRSLTEGTLSSAQASRASPTISRKGADHDSSHLIEPIPRTTKKTFISQNAPKHAAWAGVIPSEVTRWASAAALIQPTAASTW